MTSHKFESTRKEEKSVDYLLSVSLQARILGVLQLTEACHPHL